MPSYTVDTSDTGFLAAVQRLAHIPIAQNTFTTAGLCAFGDSETRTSLLKQILSVREGYYLTYVDIPVNATGIYPIPYRAIAGRIHDVQMVVGTSVYQLARIEPRDMTNTINPPTNTYAFWLQGNYIVTLPILSSGSVRIWHYVRPSNLVASTSCGQVTVITPTTVTVSAAPSTFLTGVNIDFTQAQPPFGLLSYDVAISNIVSNTLTFASGAIPSTLAVGDWICLAGTTPVPQMPLEFYPLLEQRVAVKVLESQGYAAKLEVAQKKLMEMEKDVLSIINPRDEGNPKKITPNRGVVGPGPSRKGFWNVAP
jgi:hypothetical protein